MIDEIIDDIDIYELVQPKFPEEDLLDYLEDEYRWAYWVQCGLCGNLFRDHLPAGEGRLICYSDECIAEYDKAKIEINRESHSILLAPPPRIEKKEKPIVHSEKIFNPRFGYIYLMRSENGLYKIGRAKDVEARRSGLERDIPMRVEIIHTIASANYLLAEKTLHYRYAQYRKRYEWFELSLDHVAEIKAISDYGLDVKQ